MGLGYRDALDPVHTALVLQARPGVVPLDQHHHLAEPTHVGLPGLQRLDRPAVVGGKGQVHLVQVPGEQIGLLAPLGTPDLNDHRPTVVWVSRQQQGAKFALQTQDFILQR